MRRSREGHLPPGARPLRPVLGIDELPAEALAELLGVRTLREAKHVHVHAVTSSIKCIVATGLSGAAVEGMPTRAQRQILGKEVDGHEAAARAAVCGEHHLMRLVAVDCRFAELASSVDHGHHHRGDWWLTALEFRSRAFAERADSV